MSVMMMVMVSAAALLSVVMFMMVMLVLIMVVMAVLMFIVIVVTMLMAFMIIMVLVIVIVVMMMVMVMMLILSRFFSGLLYKVGKKSVPLFHDGKELLTGKLGNGSGDDLGSGVEASDQLNIIIYLFLIRDDIGTAEYHGTCILNLVVEELTKVLHVHPALIGIHYGNR